MTFITDPISAKLDLLEDLQPTTEMLENQGIYDELFNVEYTEGLLKQLIRPIVETWFRAECVGFEEYPQRNNFHRPLIFASNHSGMAFPWDAIVFGYLILRRFKQTPDSIRALTSPMLSMSSFMNPFAINNLWKKAGAIDATFLNFETMMFYNKKNLLIYPEGVPGIGKGFDKRYQFQEVKTSMLRMSIKYKTDIIPFSTVNGEYINPYTYSNNVVNYFMNKMGMPFLPLGAITIFILIQPWVFYIAFPAKLTYVKGRRLKPYQWIDKDYEDITQDDFKELAAKVQKSMQEDLDKAVADHGQKPYNWKELFTKLGKNIKSLPYNLPFLWPILFTEYNRKYRKNKSTKFSLPLRGLSVLWMMIKNPITISFFIPVLGWLPLIIRDAYFKKKKKNQEKKNSNK